MTAAKLPPRFDARGSRLGRNDAACAAESSPPRFTTACCFILPRQLFDYLVGAQHNRWRYRKAQRLGGLAVQDHLELGRKLHREITRLLAAQDAIDIGGGTTKGVYQVGSVGKQTAV